MIVAVRGTKGSAGVGEEGCDVGVELGELCDAPDRGVALVAVAEGEAVGVTVG